MTQNRSEITRENDNNEPLNHSLEASPKRKRRYSDPDDTRPDFSGLSQRQRKLLTVIANARTITEAASRARLSRSTIHRWLRDETFQEALAYTRASKDFISRLRIRNRVDICLDSLLDAALEEPDPAVRIRAARSFLTFVVQTGQWERINYIGQPTEDQLSAPSVSPEEPVPTPPLAFPPPPGVD